MATIDRQLPFEYTIASRSTDVMVWNAVYDAHNEVVCLMLERGRKLVGPYVIKMKNYEEKLECLGYVLPQDLSVGLILSGISSDYKSNKKSLNAKGKGKGKGKEKDKSYIPKPKNPKSSAKEHPTQDDTYHHYKEVGHCKRNCPAYLAELNKKKKLVGIASSSNIFVVELFSFPTKSWVYDTGCGTHKCNTKYGLRGVRKLKQVKAIRSDNLVLPNGLVWGCGACEACVKRNTPDKLQQRSVKCIFIGYPKETMEVSGRAVELKEIQDEDILPFDITSENPMEVEEVEEHSLTGFNEPANYKAAMLYMKSDKWLDAMNAEMQSIKDNQVWHLVDLPPNSRLVARGYTQLYGVDYEETFSPVADNRAIRILIAITAFYHCEIWKVCKLQISIYGLKQASMSWNKRFDEEIKRIFKMDTSKRGYIHMQERIDLNKTQGDSTPRKVKRMQNVRYASAVGSIMYAVRCTRPDVTFALNITSHFQQNPGEPYWTAMKTILKYLRNTKDMFLVYDGNPKAELRVDCYCNARFKTDRDEIKSQTKYVFILNRRRSRLEKLQAMYYYNVRNRS
ncbi:retrotransposon protein, putative, ty1-copia subclass [Tanacetum coccineum]